MRQIVSRELLDIPPVAVQHGAGVADSAALYERYLEGHGLLGHGFVFREIVRLRHVPGGPGSESLSHMLPHPRYWHRMVPTLALAQVLRDRMVAEGAHGLRIAAAYRPAGGEDRSLHKVNAAIDLDLLPADLGLDRVFARVAAELWREHRHLQAGIGTYAPALKGGTTAALWTRRVHLDTGYRFRAWQGTGCDSAGRRTWAEVPAALVLAGSDDPSREDQGLVADASGPEV